MFNITKCDLSAGEAVLDYDALIKTAEMAVSCKLDDIVNRVAEISNDFRAFKPVSLTHSIGEALCLETSAKNLSIALEVLHTLREGKTRPNVNLI